MTKVKKKKHSLQALIGLVLSLMYHHYNRTDNVIFLLLFLNLHVKALLKALVYMILRFSHNVMDVVNVVMFYLVIISDATHEFLPGCDKD